MILKRIYLTYVLLQFVLLVLPYSLEAQTTFDTVNENNKSVNQWKGFERYDFKFNSRDARLIVPASALAGNPWIWRARFPDWHTQADSILVAEGYHLAYINTDNMYGSPEAITIWDAFYTFLNHSYGLHKKVALMGVSRGGLFIYNWAKQNPDKVASIYAEAPVCDFKIWPGGFGSSEGNPEDWEKLKKAYGFNSDQEANLYTDNPIDGLEVLAANKIPILHMIGLNDKIVPADENTMSLISKYISLGGIATVVPCTEGEQELEGHHFPIDSPRKVADFIQYHRPKAPSLSSSEFHQLRSGFINSQIKFIQSKKGRVAFLGGSITYNTGWRDSISDYLKRKFPDTSFEFINAGISSMGSTPAAFRLTRDVLSATKVDLLFEEAAVNDATNKRTNEEQVRAMEGIVRQLRKSNPAMDIVIMHFADPDKITDYTNNRIPEVITNHNRVATHYQIPTIDLAKEVSARIANEEFEWKKDFKDLHPSPFGQGIYAHSIAEFLDAAYDKTSSDQGNILLQQLPEKINTDSYDNGGLISINEAKLSGGWHINRLWIPNDGTGTRSNYTEVPMLIGNAARRPLKLNFVGNAIGIAVAAGQDTGIIEYRIDKGAWKEQNLFTQWSSSLHLPWYYTLATGLSSQRHVLEIRLSEKKDKRSTGNSCRIRYFYTNAH